MACRFLTTTGDCINPELIQQARQEEMNGFRDMEVYEYVSRQEALSDPTGTVVGVRWVDHNKRTSIQPEVPSRLVAQEIASKDRRDDLFAATPPLAVSSWLVWRAAAKGGAPAGQDHAYRCEEGVSLREHQPTRLHQPS